MNGRGRICNSRRRRIPVAIDEINVAAGYGAGERVVSRAVSGGIVDVSPMFSQITGRFEMSKDGCQRHDREFIEGVGIRQGGIFLYDFFIS